MIIILTKGRVLECKFQIDWLGTLFCSIWYFRILLCFWRRIYLYLLACGFYQRLHIKFLSHRRPNSIYWVYFWIISSLAKYLNQNQQIKVSTEMKQYRSIVQKYLKMGIFLAVLSIEIWSDTVLFSRQEDTGLAKPGSGALYLKIRAIFKSIEWIC